MKIVAISDIHGYLEKPENMPEGDVLCICGDIVPLDAQRNMVKSISWFCLDFVPWVESLPYEKVIFIAGNHDFFLDNIAKSNDQTTYVKDAKHVMEYLLYGKNKSKHKKLVYLFDSEFTYKRIKFYGTPWISGLPGWAFNKDEYDEISKEWDKIPDKVDVLLTHMPSIMCGTDTVLQSNAFNYMSFYGSPSLANAIEKRDIKYALCGHVHSGEHYPSTSNLPDSHNTIYVNVSIKNEDYKVSYKPFVFEV